MECFNDLCVFWKGDTFTLDEISVNELGMCKEYISVDITSDDLEKYREEHLQRHREYALGYK